MTKKSKKSTAKQIGDAVAYGKLKEKVGRVPTPKQQREAGVITGVMVGQALGGMFGPRHLALSKKAAEKTDDVVAAVVKKAKKTTKTSKKAADKAVKKIKAVVDKYGDPPNTLQGDIDFAKSRAAIVLPAAAIGYGAKYIHERDKKKKLTKKPPEMAKGGYVKKYAKGGGARKAR